MIQSIRKFLLIYLLLAIIVITALTVAGNYFLDQQDIEEHLDLMLSEAGFTFEALLGSDYKQRNLEEIQASMNAIPYHIHSLEQLYNEQLPNQSDQRYQFQVWDNQGKVIIRTAGAPSIPLSSNHYGFNTTTIHGEIWRTFTKYSPRVGLTIMSSELYNIRNRLAHRIALDDIYIILLTYPIAGFLIWIIVGVGLSGIRRVAHEVSNRLPHYLDPVDPTMVPIEIKPLVVELNKLFMRLQDALDREKRFAADAAHELKTPLAALKTQAQVAKNTVDEKERRQQLQKVISGVDRCAHVVQQLLTLSRLVPEANTLTDTVDLKLSKVATEVMAELAPIALDKKIDIELEARGEKARIHGNATALSILLRNLIDNAIRYTPENGAIQVVITSQENQVILRVTDNGPGIPAELRSRVFERFFRVLGNKSPGSGLGLAIVQQISQLHNAQLKLGPNPHGKGLQVEVVFPSVA